MALPSAYNPDAWSAFFLLVGTAAATLAGLFFVVFSLRLQEIQRSIVLRVRARYLLLGTIAMTVGAGFVLMPRQSLTWLAAEILSGSVALGAHTAWSLIRAARQEPLPVSPDQIGRWIGFALILLLNVGASISLIVRNGGGLYLFAFSMLLAFAVQVVSAWSLITGIGEGSRRQEVPSQATEQVSLP